MELDRYDRAILRLLQQDARITNTLLAEKVSLSESACLRRVRALEESGLVQGYTALIDQQKAGYPVNVFVSITLDRQSQSGLETFENAVRKIPALDDSAGEVRRFFSAPALMLPVSRGATYRIALRFTSTE
jgi:Lrp/AsnC family leucine-responsive transcriptional regulator